MIFEVLVFERVEDRHEWFQFEVALAEFLADLGGKWIFFEVLQFERL